MSLVLCVASENMYWFFQLIFIDGEFMLVSVGKSFYSFIKKYL